MKVKFWTCGNCGHEELITDNDLQELNPVVSSAGAITVSYTHLTLPTTERV